MARIAPHSTTATVRTVPAWQPLLADVISYGYAVLVAIVVLTQDLAMGWGESTAILVLYVMLRAAARDVRRSYRISQRAAR